MQISETKYRNLYIEDFDKYARLSALQSEHEPCSRQEYENKLIFFPEGQVACEYLNDLVLTFDSMLINSDYCKKSDKFPVKFPFGFISEHAKEGDSIFIYKIQKNTEYLTDSHVSGLLNHLKRNARRLNLKHIFVSLNITADDFYRIKRDNEKRIFTDTVDFEAFLVRMFEEDNFTIFGEDESGTTSDKVIFKWSNHNYKVSEKPLIRTVQPVKICAVQYKYKPVDSMQQFYAQCLYNIKLASSYKCDIVLLPEYIPFQNFYHVDFDLNNFDEIVKMNDEIIFRISEYCRNHKIDVVMGGIWNKVENKRHSSTVFIGRNGIIVKQHNIHLAKIEQEYSITPGDELITVSTNYAELGLISGYDLLFPEITRLLAEKGITILLTSFNAKDTWEHKRIEYAAHGRAVENQIFVAGASGFGAINFPGYDKLYSKSFIYTPVDLPFPKNGIAAEGEMNSESPVISSVDIDLLRNNRQIGSSTNWIDRRPDLYSINWHSEF